MTQLKLSRKRLRSSEEDGELFFQSPKRRDLNYNRDALYCEGSLGLHLQNGFANGVHPTPSDQPSSSDFHDGAGGSASADSRIPFPNGMQSHAQHPSHLFHASPQHHPPFENDHNFSIPEDPHQHLALSSMSDNHYYAINRVLRDAHFAKLSRQQPRLSPQLEPE